MNPQNFELLRSRRAVPADLGVLAARSAHEDPAGWLIWMGNLIRQAEMLKKLGVEPSKAPPATWVDAAMDELA